MNLLLIDLSSIAHAQYHVSASNPDSNETCRATVARVRALASGQPHVGICVEGGRSFRKDINADYKANRPEHDAALQYQIALAIDTLKADGFPVWSAAGFEADDVLASATDLARRINYGEGGLDFGDYVRELCCGEPPSVTIASSDKDLLQLVGPRVTVHSLTSGMRFDEDAVVAKFGVKPDQMVDFLSLVGDASDNVKGAKGIGPKKAAELLSRYGNLEDLYAALTQHGTQFTPGLATALREFEPRIAEVRSLITLRRDVPVPIEEAFRERVPCDVAVFGSEEEIMDDTQAPTGTLAPPPADTVVPSVPNGGDSGQTFGLPGSNPGRGAGPTLSPVVAGTEAHASSSQHSLALRAEVEPAPVEWERQLEPRSFSQTLQLGQVLHRSRLFSAYGSPEAIASTILVARELGLDVGAGLRGIHVVDGRHMLSSDLIRALVARSGASKYFRCAERTADKATFITERKDDPGNPITLTYSIEEARVAGLVKPKSGWEKNPADMLVARASSKLARLVYPEVVFSMYAPEEID